MTVSLYGEVIRATFFFNLQHKLKSVVARITAHLKHCQATKCCKLKNLLKKKVNASWTCCNMLLELATTEFCCVTMFEVGGNTCNKASAFQLATEQRCVASGRKMKIHMKEYLKCRPLPCKVVCILTKPYFHITYVMVPILVHVVPKVAVNKFW